MSLNPFNYGVVVTNASRQPATGREVMIAGVVASYPELPTTLALSPRS